LYLLLQPLVFFTYISRLPKRLKKIKGLLQLKEKASTTTNTMELYNTEKTSSISWQDRWVILIVATLMFQTHMEELVLNQTYEEMRKILKALAPLEVET